ncbi:MAG TPA: PQQ-binding-like beta-propeller repeat protein [Gemmataceae bacterium]|nr:PQQ-binding-like beta-propeller repeat protein [Gemmataceae bacterium]
MRAFLTILVFLAASFAFAEPPDLGTRHTGSDWPRFLGPTADSISTETGIIKPWPKDGLKVVWQKKLSLGYAPPAVSRGRLFVFDSYIDAEKKQILARLTCRNAETGAELWKFEYPTDYDDFFGYDNGPRCSPIVDGDHVFILGVEGMLHCLRAVDGKEVWKVDTRQEFNVIQNFFGVASCPVVEGDLLLVAVGGSPKETVIKDFANDFMGLKSNGSAIVAFDKQTGKVKYRGGDELSGYSTPVVTTVAGQRIGLYFARGGLLEFNPQTGEQKFHYPWRARILESVNASNPLVVGDKVLLTECYGPGSVCLKIKPGGADVIWSDENKDRREKSLQGHWNTPIHRDGFVYGCSGRHTAQAELRCIELATGKLMWRKPGLTRSSLLLVDGHIVCLCEDGLLLLLRASPDQYQEVSRIDLNEAGLLDYPCWAAPVLSHGLLYLRGKERLVCLELIPKK